MTKTELLTLILNSKTPALPADSVQFVEVNKKKFFEIEFKRESYLVLTIEAENAEQAEQLAWKEIEARPDTDDASWGVESIEEL